MSGSCVEKKEFNVSMNGAIYSKFCLMRFRHSLHMLSHYAHLSSSILAFLFGSMHTFLVGLEA